MAGVGAPASTRGQQQDPIPVITWQTPAFPASIVNSILGNSGRYLRTWLCRVRYKGNFSADPTV